MDFGAIIIGKNDDYFQSGFLEHCPFTQLVVKTDKPRPKLTQLVEPLCSMSGCFNKQRASAKDAFKLFREICKWLAYKSGWQKVVLSVTNFSPQYIIAKRMQ